jgi:hypothetical protein
MLGKGKRSITLLFCVGLHTSLFASAQKEGSDRHQQEGSGKKKQNKENKTKE